MVGVRWAGGLTWIAMLLMGAFWMFMWLIGGNGFSSSRWLTQGWPFWKATKFAVVFAFAACLAFLTVTCFGELATASA